MDNTCIWCNKEESEHGQLDESGRRLCPVRGVSSQFWSSRWEFAKSLAIRTAQQFRDAKASAIVYTEQAFPVGCQVRITLETCQIVGTVHCHVEGSPDRVACLLEN